MNQLDCVGNVTYIVPVELEVYAENTELSNVNSCQASTPMANKMNKLPTSPTIIALATNTIRGDVILYTYQDNKVNISNLRNIFQIKLYCNEIVLKVKTIPLVKAMFVSSIIC